MPRTDRFQGLPLHDKHGIITVKQQWFCVRKTVSRVPATEVADGRVGPKGRHIKTVSINWREGVLQGQEPVDMGGG